MSSNTYQQIALILLVLCIVSPIESRYEKERKQEKSIGATAARTQPQSADQQTSVSLCKKDRTLPFLCHCTPEDESIKAQKGLFERRTRLGDGLNSFLLSPLAECWIVSPELTRKDPQWLAFNTQTQLQHLKFSVLSSGNLSFIPTDILQSLKYLRTINIEYGQIHELHSFAFANLTVLMNISLGNNQVKVVSAYTFANHMHLHEINLEKNEIYELDRLSLINLPNLNRLNLEHNRLEVIQDETFDTLTKLSELLLNNNSISKLTREIFKGLGNLQVLKMANNKLSFLADTVFAELWSLRELELQNNQIEVSVCSIAHPKLSASLPRRLRRRTS
jgi:Leucine rich repeat